MAQPAEQTAPKSGPGAGADNGRWIIGVALWGTALFTVSAVLAAAWPSVFRLPAAVVALVLFALGIPMFLVAYARAIGRSRTELVSVAGVFFLAGCAPRAVQVRMLGALAVQVVVAVATASVRPFSSLAYGVLVPMFGIACAGLWGAFHGTFPARQDRSASLPADDRPGDSPSHHQCLSRTVLRGRL
jgi:hypothetical protein